MTEVVFQVLSILQNISILPITVLFRTLSLLLFLLSVTML